MVKINHEVEVKSGDSDNFALCDEQAANCDEQSIFIRVTSEDISNHNDYTVNIIKRASTSLEKSLASAPKITSMKIVTTTTSTSSSATSTSATSTSATSTSATSTSATSSSATSTSAIIGVEMAWQPPSDTDERAIKGYRILRSKVNYTAYVEIHDTLNDANPTALTYTDKNVESDTTYLYRVKAVYEDCSVSSDSYALDDSERMSMENPERIEVPSLPVLPSETPAATPTVVATPQMGDGSDVNGSNNGKSDGAVAVQDGITVTWMAPGGATTVKGYIILRLEAGERQADETGLENEQRLAGSERTYREIHNTLDGVTPTATTYTDKNVEAGITYLYRVRAINENCYISLDPTRLDQSGYYDNNFGKATAK